MEEVEKVDLEDLSRRMAEAMGWKIAPPDAGPCGWPPGHTSDRPLNLPDPTDMTDAVTFAESAGCPWNVHRWFNHEREYRAHAVVGSNEWVDDDNPAVALTRAVLDHLGKDKR